MERISNEPPEEVRQAPDPMRLEKQIQELQHRINVKREPDADLENSEDLMSRQGSASVCEVTPDKRQLQSECSPSIFNSDIRKTEGKMRKAPDPRRKQFLQILTNIKKEPVEMERTEEAESRQYSKPVCEVTPDKSQLQSGCSQSLCNSDIRKTGGEMRKEPDPTRNENQLQFLPILSSIKKEPLDDLKSSEDLESRQCSTPVCEVTPHKSQLQSECNPSIFNSVIRKTGEEMRKPPDPTRNENQLQFLQTLTNIKKEPLDDLKSTEDLESRQCSTPVCGVTPDKRQLQNECNPSIFNSDIRKTGEEMRKPPDPTRNENQFQFLPILINIKKEPVEEIEITKGQESRQYSTPVCEVTLHKRQLQSECNPSSIFNSDIRKTGEEVRKALDPMQNEDQFLQILTNIKKEPVEEIEITEDQESRQCSTPVCEVTPDNRKLQSGCRTIVGSDNILIEAEDQESNLPLTLVCEVTPESRKRKSDELNPFLGEKLEMIRKRLKQEPPDSPPAVDDAVNDCTKRKKPETEEGIKLIPISQLRNIKAKNSLKPVSSEIKETESISCEDLLNESEAKRLKESPAVTCSSAPNVSATTTPVGKSDNSNVCSLQIEAFSTGNMEFAKPMNVCREQKESATDKVFKLIPISNKANMTAKNNLKPAPISVIRKIESTSFDEHQLKESESKRLRMLSTTVCSSPSNVSALSTPAYEPEESGVSLLETENFSINVMKFFNACPAINKKEIELGIEYISKSPLSSSFDMLYKRQNSQKDKQRHKVSEDSVCEPVKTTSEKSNYFGFGVSIVKNSVTERVSGDLLEISGKATRASVICTTQPKRQDSLYCTSMPPVLQSVTKTVSKLTSKVLGKAAVFPSCELQPSNPSVPQMSTRELQGILSKVKSLNSCDAALNPQFNVISSTSAIAQTSNGHRVNFDYPEQVKTIPVSSFGKSRRSPVVNRFLAMKNEGFNQSTKNDASSLTKS